MLELLQRIEDSALGAIARESLYGFQILVAIHLLGLIFSLGTLLWIDLRMLGLCLTSQRLDDVYRELSRWFIAGFAIMFVSGTALFAGFATSAYENFYFRIKIVVMILAGLNAIAFHLLLRRTSKPADSDAPAISIRAAGLFSIAAWGAVAFCGRMMSYTLF
jgi:hypothetical protein